jgi:hypothetical protein
MGSFTYGWRHSEMARYRDGDLVRLAYGSQFASRGVRPNDEVYFVSVHRGHVYLIGKMRALAVTHSGDDCRRWAGPDLAIEPAAEYLLAQAISPCRLVRLSDETTRALRFVRRNDLSAALPFQKDKVSAQCLRGVRRLTPSSARLLDALLPGLVACRFGPTKRRIRKET